MKQILAMASGQPVTSFSGGVEGANKVLAEKGIEIVPLRPLDKEEEQPMARFREAVQRILEGYRQGMTEKFSNKHAISQLFAEASRALAAPRKSFHVRSRSFLPLEREIGRAFPGFRCLILARPTPRSAGCTSSTYFALI